MYRKLLTLYLLSDPVLFSITYGLVSPRPDHSRTTRLWMSSTASITVCTNYSPSRICGLLSCVVSCRCCNVSSVESGDVLEVPEVRHLAHTMTDRLTAVTGWCELGEYRLALASLSLCGELLTQIYRLLQDVVPPPS
jgi:hypothetical protein